ncbi:hypothetical protein D3C71_1780960 [compost metagenome]
MRRYQPYFIHRGQHLRTWGWHERGRDADRLVVRYREIRVFPSRISLIHDVYAVMPQIAQQPPQSGGKGTALVVVCDDNIVPADPGSAQHFSQRFGIGKRMAAAMPAERGGQLLLQMQIDRSRNVISLIGGTSCFGIGQKETAIRDNQIWFIHAG